MTDDDDLLAALRDAAARVDPPPDAVVAAARAALSTRRLDEELAALVADSDLVGAGVLRGDEDGEPRLLSFESGDVTLDLQVERARDVVTLRGLVAGATGEAEVETAERRHTAAIGDDGWFTVGDLAGGPMRVRLSGLVTGWVLI